MKHTGFPCVVSDAEKGTGDNLCCWDAEALAGNAKGAPPAAATKKLFLAVLSVEAVNPASGVNKALLAGVEGVAVGADFKLHPLALGGPGLNFIATGARDGGFVSLGVDIGFHC